MARVALVTGGSRGIGAAISTALQAAGCQVAATYAGNDAAAAEFKAATGIAVFKWDVADAEACKAGIAAVEAELGPVEILVNNAGITRDAPFHRMTLEQWQQVHVDQRRQPVHDDPAGVGGDARPASSAG